ncbi:hypothetical protein ACLK1G_00620 [Pseudomonas sp. NR3]|uniref:hypothetical protein n=1 Tax=Pseudomonas sp. NR3 TaxID=3155978 RepID=UPI003B66D1DE
MPTLSILGRVVLVDTGTGELFGSVGGKLPESLVAAGYQPAQISDVRTKYSQRLPATRAIGSRRLG